MTFPKTSGGRLPAHGWLGIGLIALFWWLNWSLTGLRTQWAFFPLWTGFTLVIDALVYLRKGSSLLLRCPRVYFLLFVLSVPTWWVFELLNWRTQNWHYLGRQYFSALEYFSLASLSFSTVMPAVFESAELMGTLAWVKRRRFSTTFNLSKSKLAMFALSGFIMLVLLLTWPEYFFPFLWLSIYLILDPLNVRLGYPALLSRVSKGDWRTVAALWCGVLLCGAFWEMWNYCSYPKWVYHVPFVGFAHIFEMPILGYLGYLPFALELYAVVCLVRGLCGRGNIEECLAITGEEV